jgi:acyl-CoA synthetase (AMP-forming)/AMP-acid ligase II
MIPYRELKKAASKWGGKTAFVTDQKTEVTFEVLLERVDRVAGALEGAGIGKGDVVAGLLPNIIEFVELFLAAGAVGAVFQPLDIRFRGEELTHALVHTGAKVLAVHETGVETAEPGLPDIGLKLLVGKERPGWIRYETFAESGQVPTVVAEVDEDNDNAVYLFTSGTTGSLKCVPMTWRQLDHFPRDMADRLGSNPDDRGITLLPLSHISGPIIVSMVVSVGCSFVVTHRWRPDIIVDLFEQFRVTWAHTVPALADLILKGRPEGRDLSSVRFLALMGTRVPADMLLELERAIPSCKAIQGYGLTETSPLLTLMDVESHESKRGSIGSAVGDVDIRVVDSGGRDVETSVPGELMVRGPKVFSGYVGNPELTSQVFEGDWFHTGDVVQVDADGFFFHLGRLDDVINTGGMKVYPTEVEGALLKHPGIEEVVAYGVPDEQRGYAVAADVQLVDGASVNKVELQKYLDGQLADYKIPRNIVFVDEIDHTPTGKPIRRSQ